MKHRGKDYSFFSHEFLYNLWLLLTAFLGFGVFFIVVITMIEISPVAWNVAQRITYLMADTVGKTYAVDSGESLMDALFYYWIAFLAVIYTLILAIIQFRMYAKTRLYAREFIAPDNGDEVIDAPLTKVDVTITLRRGHIIEKETIDYSGFFIKVYTRDDITIPIFYVKNGYIEKVEYPYHIDKDSNKLYEIIGA